MFSFMTFAEMDHEAERRARRQAYDAWPTSTILEIDGLGAVRSASVYSKLINMRATADSD